MVLGLLTTARLFSVILNRTGREGKQTYYSLNIHGTCSNVWYIHIYGTYIHIYGTCVFYVYMCTHTLTIIFKEKRCYCFGETRKELGRRALVGTGDRKEKGESNVIIVWTKKCTEMPKKLIPSAG